MPPFVIYSRKSLEDDDSQVQSIPDQQQAMKAFAERASLQVVLPLLEEAKSAKAPGRPVFESMMKRVESGKLHGILCWKLDRLARNPVDGGRIIWAMKQHGLVVRTPQQSFSRENDNLILMYIEFGMAQKYVDDLSRNTTRGLVSKAAKGWCPGPARLGYLNSKVEERAKKTVLVDPERFPAVRRMWDLMLTGTTNPARIQKLAVGWGLRTRQTKKTGGKPVVRSAIYRIFSDPFYYGSYEYPKTSGNWYQGQHQPMITKAEFDSVQKILQRQNNPRPQTSFPLPFRGLLKCGECGSSITAHFKEQVRCTRCRYKSSVKNNAACSRCGTAIRGMKSPKVRRYAYYHCTHTLNPRCRQKFVSAKALETQLTEQLQRFSLPKELKEWGFNYIDKLREQDLQNERQILTEKKKASEQCDLRLENLMRLKTSPANFDNSLLSDEEYQKERADLLRQKESFAKTALAFERELEGKERGMKEVLNTMATLDGETLEVDQNRQGEILRALGLNHVLMGKKLMIKPEFPFSDFDFEQKQCDVVLTPIEPEKSQVKQGQKSQFTTPCPESEQRPDEDRTRQLKAVLERIWKKIDLSAGIFNRYPFKPGEPMIPPQRRNRKGRFLSDIDPITN